MNAVHVELTGASPMLHNRIWSDGSGWTPASDAEQAESRLHRDGDGSLYLPWWTPSVAIGRAAWSLDRTTGVQWPREILYATAARNVLKAERVDFDGEWKPQVFLRRDLPPVALPRFDWWSAAFTLDYDPAWHDEATLREVLEHSGKHIGLPTFAPFAGAGPWGLFKVAKWEPARVGVLDEAAA